MTSAHHQSWTSYNVVFQDINARLVKEHSNATTIPDMPSATSPVLHHAPPTYSVAKLHLDLPKFSGKSVNWAGFHDLVTAAID